MNRPLSFLLLCTFVAVPAWSQDSEGESELDTTADDTVIEEELASEPEPEPEPEYDETGLDDQGFSNEDDDFDPTETIPTDQSIEFPTDI